MVMFDDLNGDGRLELLTCEDGWEGDYCSFADAPFAPVVLAYDVSSRVYAPATPRFGERYRQEIVEMTTRAETAIRETNGGDSGLDTCSALAPVLPLLYTGRTDDGVALLRSLYTHDDERALEAEVLSRMRSSPFWVER
jgi:hypothetical protein